MGNIVGIVSDDEIIRFCFAFPNQLVTENLIESGKKLPFFHCIYQNDKVQRKFLLYEDQIDTFVQRDVAKFREFLTNFIEIFKDFQNVINLSGSEAENNMKIQKQILNIVQSVGIKSLQFIHTKFILSITYAIHYIIPKEGTIFHFTNPIDIINYMEIKDKKQIQPQKEFTHDTVKYPYLLVNLRGGVSFYKVQSRDKVQRIQGSIIGESMLEGVISLINNKNYNSIDINQIIKQGLTEGDNKNVDMTVEDIYGEDTSQLGLPKDLLASSLGKVAKGGDKAEFKQQDLVNSLIHSLCINVSLLTNLTQQLYPEITQAVFVFWKIENEMICFLLQCFVEYYTKKKMGAYFVEKSNYLATVGVLAKIIPKLEKDKEVKQSSQQQQQQQQNKQ